MEHCKWPQLNFKHDRTEIAGMLCCCCTPSGNNGLNWLHPLPWLRRHHPRNLKINTRFSFSLKRALSCHPRIGIPFHSLPLPLPRPAHDAAVHVDTGGYISDIPVDSSLTSVSIAILFFFFFFFGCVFCHSICGRGILAASCLFLLSRARPPRCSPLRQALSYQLHALLPPSRGRKHL